MKKKKSLISRITDSLMGKSSKTTKAAKKNKQTRREAMKEMFPDG